MGGSRSPLDEHRDWLLARIREKPDLTLQDLRRSWRPGRVGRIWLGTTLDHITKPECANYFKAAGYFQRERIPL